MGALFDLIDGVEDMLGHSPHPAIVSLPLGAWSVSAIADAMGSMTHERAYDDAARISMGIGLVGAVGAAVTGYHDYTYIPADSPSHPIATAHAAAMIGSTALLAASYVLRAGGRDEHGPGFLARMLGLGGWGLSVYGGYLGGVLVEEHGEAVKPVIERQKKEKREREKALA
jgi:uncharacterized membrane protein